MDTAPCHGKPYTLHGVALYSFGAVYSHEHETVMTPTLLEPSGHSLVFFCGLLILLYSTYKAFLTRASYRKLLSWGALADMSFAMMAFAAAQGLATTGALLFVLFQLTARALAFSAHETLYNEAQKRGSTQKGARCIHQAVTHNPLAALLFAFGMLAAVGGSPFLIPEGRFFAIQGILEAQFFAAIPVILLVVASATTFIYWHVDAVRKVYLEYEHNVPAHSASLSLQGKASIISLILAFLLMTFGLFRAPLTDICAHMVQIQIVHASSHMAFLLLFGGAFVSLLLSYTRPQWIEKCALCIFALAFLAVAFLGDMSPLSKLFALLITGMGFVVTLYSAGYMVHGQRSYYFFLLLTFAALVGIVSTSHLGNFYGYWELMTFASYFLVVHESIGKKIDAISTTILDAGSKYYIMCAGGALVMLPGLALLGGSSALLTAIPDISQAMPSFTLKITLILALTGFAVKAGLVPLQAWLPDAHPAAPSSVSGPLSGIITKLGIFGILSLLLGQAGGAALAQHAPMQGHLPWIGYMISFLGGATLIYGELMALRQDDIKRLLAYSTLGQVGEIVLVLGLGTYLSTVAALTHVINHAIMKDLLFLGVGALILRTGSRKLQDLRGLGEHMPFTVGCLCVGLIAIMGLPPFAGFVGKFLMIQAAIQTGHWLMAVIIIAGSLVGAIYYTRILRTLVFEKACNTIPAAPHLSSEQQGFMNIALGILTALCILLGLFPELSQGSITAAAAQYFPATDTAQALLQSMQVSWPIYVIVPMLGALVPYILRANHVRAGRAAMGILLLTALLVLLFGQDMDKLSFGFSLIVPLLGALNMAYAVGYMEHSHTQWRFYAFFCVLCAGLLGLASATYLYSFFLFWEIMSSWALYFTLAHEGTAESLREAFKYFLFNLAGAGCIFLGVCLLGAATPLSLTASLSILSNSLSGVWPMTENIGYAAYALLALGFVMKAAQLPFRIDWQMHPALAPTPVSGFISSVLLKSALLGLMKLFVLIGGGLTLASALDADHRHSLHVIIMWIGAITIVMAATQALLSNGLKLIFIYSTVSQIGYMVLALAAGTSLGYAGGLLHVVNHIFFKDLLFLMCGVLMFQSHKDHLQDLGGIGHKMPFTLTMFTIAGLSVVGIPPTSGFTSKWIIYHALMQIQQPFLALLSLIGSVITLAYIAKFLHTAFMGQPGPHLAHMEDAPRSMRTPMTILAVGCVALGLFPGLMLMPINGIIQEYGFSSLHVGLTGLTDGPAAWNATNMFVMMFLAFLGTWKGLNYFVRKNYRITPVHTCGLNPEQASSRMLPSSVYGGLMTFWRESFLPALRASFSPQGKKEK